MLRYVYLMYISKSGDLQKKIMKNKEFKIAPPVKMVLFKFTPLYASIIIRLHDIYKISVSELFISSVKRNGLTPLEVSHLS